MARNIIRLAGGTYERLKALKGTEVLRDREVVIAKDTNELYVGKEEGNFELLGNVHIGQTKVDITLVDPQKGRFFYCEEDGELYLANGTGWKKIASSFGFKVKDNCGLELNTETGELELKLDNKSIVVDENGNLATGNQDFGEF